MNNYQKLTKIITDEQGNERIACVLFGTEKCRTIHKDGGCTTCPMIAAMMNQLAWLEDYFIQKEGIVLNDERR